MANKKKIIQRVKIVLTQDFENFEDAFNFFDKNGDGKLVKSEIKRLLKKAKINGFIRGVVADKLIEEFDQSDDQQISWKEFKKAVKAL